MITVGYDCSQEARLSSPATASPVRPESLGEFEFPEGVAWDRQTA